MKELNQDIIYYSSPKLTKQQIKVQPKVKKPHILFSNMNKF